MHYGYRAGRIIYEEGHKLVITEYCSSACAEFLLPAAKSLVFDKSPLIGFHGNSLSRESLIREQAGQDAVFCHSTLGLNTRIRQLYKKTGHNPDFWKTQYKHLNVTDKTIKQSPFSVKKEYEELVVNGTKLRNIKECYTIDVKTSHPFWFPTSKQLKTGFGLKFEGDVCADNQNCYEDKLDKIYPKGTSLAVGDTVYISKGSPE